MQLGEVLGSVTAPQQVSSLASHRLLVVRRMQVDDEDDPRECEVAVDLVGAGPGDRVLLAAGSAARITPETRSVATDLTIVAIVDSVDLVSGVPPRVVVSTRTAT
jgi:carbon dioxide concentrating mechanism protein CcmL